MIRVRIVGVVPKMYYQATLWLDDHIEIVRIIGFFAFVGLVVLFILGRYL